MIIAMAGHVDHGKTSLIRALTGIDPDRLPDEKQRGMTIDLGFAHVRLQDGTLVGFVDVPGHERFLGNMLAGVLSVDTALLVVAADDGPMPQTLEHLAILRLTGVTDLAVAVTKTDRVDADRLADATAEVRDLLDNAGYPDASILPVSSQTGDGMAALTRFLSDKAAAWRPRAALGAFRLSVDRAFVMTGSGVVVTGTVVDGRVSVGDRLLLSPSHLPVRVRGIQLHHAEAETAQAGDRCALAITGAKVERDRIHRGDWLVAPHLFRTTHRIDVLARTTETEVLKHSTRVQAHLGATAIPGRAVVLDAGDLPAGQEGLVSLTLDRPTGALFADRVVLRDEGTGRVVAGGTVIDPFPPVRRTRREVRLRGLTALRHPDMRDAMAALLDAEGWIDIAAFALARNRATAELTTLAAGLPARLVGTDVRPVLLSDAARTALETVLIARLDAFHRDHAELPGLTKAALLAAVATAPPEVTEAALSALIAQGAVVRRGRMLALPGHQPALARDDQAIWTRIEPALETAALRPPRVRELAAELGLEPDVMERRLIRLERFGLLMHVAANRFFLPHTVVELGKVAETLAAENDAEGFTAAMFSQRSGIGRNLTIQVLEFLDRIGITQRVGEYRVMRRSVATVLT